MLFAWAGILPAATDQGQALPGAEAYPAELRGRLEAAVAAKGPDYVPRTEHLLPDGHARYINRLILEDSPYLLQHAHNPVNWYPWGEEAFAAARREHKPIFLSIGYSTCHWCHVMEKESFENLEIARYLNQHFIAIKVDRERRPDVDAAYMTAVMLTTGHGGWPMSSFLTPQGRPFFGGTYFPPGQFSTLLKNVNELWSTQRDYVLEQAQKIAAAVERVHATHRAARALDAGVAKDALEKIISQRDEVQGGFGTAPKFPQEPRLLLLLQRALGDGDAQARETALEALQAMARGGIYDQVGGGFHRYATTPDWLVPHFEKMLYNQAQLARAYLWAYRLTHGPLYARIARQTLDYVLRDMAAPGGGFYSATDADSAGEEGAFFLWTPEALRAALDPQDVALAQDLYGVTEQGNFEGRNILHLPLSLDAYARAHRMPLAQLLERVERIRERLYQARERRVHPGRDEKIITAWNGMMVTALAQAAEILDQPRYLEAARRTAEFLWTQARRPGGGLWRVSLHGHGAVDATLSDYAQLAEGLVALFDASSTPLWLDRARILTDEMIRRFRDPDQGGFYMNEASASKRLFTRPKRAQDAAVPSGNSVALRVLAQLAARTGEPRYLDEADALAGAFASKVRAYPASYPYLLMAAAELRHGEAGPREYGARGVVRAQARYTARDDATGQVRVDVSIREGWHINAHEPLQEDLIPTQLGVDPSSPWEGGAVDYPTPLEKRLAFLDQSLALYEGEITLLLPLRRPQGSQVEADSVIPLRLRLQACSDKVCLAPQDLRLEVAAPGGG
jgi:uncharacterized protein YyaL (SSP411 family)